MKTLSIILVGACYALSIYYFNRDDMLKAIYELILGWQVMQSAKQ